MMTLCHPRPAPPARQRAQVPLNGQHLSCCTVVRGMQRNLFVVPREPVGSEEIAALDAAAAGGDAEAKRKLIPLLHVRESEGAGAAARRRALPACWTCPAASLPAPAPCTLSPGVLLNPTPRRPAPILPPASKPLRTSRPRCASCWPSTT